MNITHKLRVLPLFGFVRKNAMLVVLLLGAFCLISTSVHSQIIITVAGDGGSGFTGDGVAATATSLNKPSGIATDATGNLHISDIDNARIRKVNASGIISTIAGTGAWGSNGDGGPATNAHILKPSGVTINKATGDLYFCEAWNSIIRKVNSLGIITAFGGTIAVSSYSGDGGQATLATFNDPTDLAVDAAGNIYIADRANYRIRKVSTSGIVSTIAGTGVLGFSGDGGPATAAQIGLIDAIAVDVAGNLYITGMTTDIVRKINVSGIISTIAGTPGVPGYSGDGGPAVNAKLRYPGGIAIDTAGNIYIAEVGNGIIRKINAGGTISTYAGTGIIGYSGDGGPATAAQLYAEGHLEVDNKGDLYLTELSINRIRKIYHLVTIGVSPNDTVCPGTSVTFTATVTGGCGTNTYQWYVNGTTAGTGGSTFTYVPNDGDQVYCHVTSTGGTCSTPRSETSLPITLTVLPRIISGPTSLCVGATTSLACIPSGGTWSSGATAIASVNGSGAVTGITAGTANVTYSTGAGCHASIRVSINPLPDAGTITGLASVCPGATFTMSDTISGGTWSSSAPGTVTINSGTGVSKSITTGTAIIRYTTGPNSNGCSATTTFTVNVVTNLFTIADTVTNVACYGDSTGSIAILTDPPGSGYTYSWSNGDSAATASHLPIGNYFVQVIQPATQCKRNATFDVSQPDSMETVVTVKHKICRPFGSLKVEVKGGTPGYRYLWASSVITDTAAEVLAADAATYTLTVTDANGCTKVKEATVSAGHCNTIFVSPGFSPNGDGINDKWSIPGLVAYPRNTVMVFDKWGDMVYEYTNYDDRWDGTKKDGGPLPDGTYYYVIKLNEPSNTGEDDVLKGTVLIKR